MEKMHRVHLPIVLKICYYEPSVGIGLPDIGYRGLKRGLNKQCLISTKSFGGPERPGHLSYHIWSPVGPGLTNVTGQTLL